MGVFLAIFIMMTTGSVAIFMVVRTRRNQHPTNEKSRIVIIHLFASMLMVSVDLIFGGHDLLLRLPLDMIFSLFPMLLITSSVWAEDVSLKLSKYSSVFVWLLTLFYVLQKTGFVLPLSSMTFVTMSGVASIVICLIFLLSVFLRMREIRQVMKNGNVWSSVCLTMDVIYMLTFVLHVIALLTAARVSMAHARLAAFLVSLLFVCEIAALALRICLDSLFVIWRRHERSIVESMKISQTDVAQDTSKINDLYKDIYTRIVTLFETEKPYLNSELTINDIVKVIFTNKLYISRAISQFTGRNFCQFVNYYRVLYSIQLFRENPDLKVIDLATRSGFNSTVSFSMAFRLYMSECPSDWCRKEKFKINRRKK